MASTFSTNLAIELIGTGDQAGTWGVTTNTNLGTLIEQAISGYVTQAVSTGADTTITIPNGATGVARNMYIELTGTGGTNTNLIVPSNKKLYFIFNNTSSGQVTVKVSGQTGVSVPNGKKVILVCNGTDVVNGLNYIADFGTNSFTVTNLTASSGTITNLIATTGTITTLSATSGNISNLVSSDASATVLRAGSATLTHLSATSASITNLALTSLTISSLSITNVSVASATVSSNLTLSGGTANGVLYLNGSKVATSGSALTFDGTNLGIGTASPSSYGSFAVLSTNFVNGYFANTSTSGTTASSQVRLATYDGSAVTAGSYLIETANSWSNSSFAGGIANTTVLSGTKAGGLSLIAASGSAPIKFYAGGEASTNELMRLTSTGLGIGTSSPARKLIVADTNAAMGLVSANTGYSELYFSDAAGSPGALSYNHNNDTLSFYTNGNNRATIDSSGNLGLGTLPNYPTRFNITNNSVSLSTNNFITIQNLGLNTSDNTNSYPIGGLLFSGYRDVRNPSNVAGIWAERSPASGGAASGGALIFGAQVNGENISQDNSLPAEAARITSGGLFGVGTTSPNFKLDVISNTTYQLRLATGDDQNYVSGGLYLGASGTSDPYYYGYMRWDQTDISLKIGSQHGNSTGGILFLTGVGSGAQTERARITAAGEFIVGTTASSYTSAGRGVIEVNGSSQSLYGFRTGGTARGYLLHEATNLIIDNSVSTGAITFQTNAAEKARITAGGLFGLGTNDPKETLQVSGGGLKVTGATTAASGSGAGLFLSYISGSNSAEIFAVDQGVAWKNLTFNAADIKFLIAGGEKARITSGGDFLVGTTGLPQANGTLGVSAAANAIRAYATTEGSAAISVDKSTNTDTSSQVFVQFTINAQTEANGRIVGNGADQVAFASWSDRRIKENIVELPSQWGNIKALRPVEFDYIKSKGGKHQIGFIAQEVQEVYSDLVWEGEDGMFGLAGFGKNEARLIKALQEAMARIEKLEAEVAALKGA